MQNEILRITGDEQSRVDPLRADGGLPPVVGVASFQVFRASRDAAEMTDQLGYTYHHHVDMAVWKGRIYVGWNSCQRDEDVWPSRELYSWSVDGAAWAEPAELFPRGVSTCLRMYFYHAGNGRMLAIAGLRTDQGDTSESKKGALVVREIGADHGLGEVYSLQVFSASDRHAAMFTESADGGFRDACRQLLGDRMYLEQQDRGRLLGERAMKWHDAAAWPGGAVPGDNEKWVAGKAYSFFRRPDGVWVGVSKMGWVTQSSDEGRSWSQPVVPETLVTGKAKLWSQRTADGRYALVYNPSKRNRFPLIVVSGEDGVTFGKMRIVQGELPIQRYAGEHRSIGPQYVRGVSHWADDGSRRENAMWLVYSMNKEDIWVSRVELPICADETEEVGEDFGAAGPGGMVARWNTYCPRWGSVKGMEGALRLESFDPYDYALATRVFAAADKVRVRCDVRVDEPNVEIDLVSQLGSRRAVTLRLEERGMFAVEIIAGAGKYSLGVNGKWVRENEPFVEEAGKLNRITFRTGAFRGIGGAKPVEIGSDRPVTASICRILNLRVAPCS